MLAPKPDRQNKPYCKEDVHIPPAWKPKFCHSVSSQKVYADVLLLLLAWRSGHFWLSGYKAEFRQDSVKFLIEG